MKTYYKTSMKRAFLLLLGAMMIAISTWAENATLTLYANGCATPNTLSCPLGTEVEVNAEALNAGSAFSHWSDESTQNPRIVTLNENISLTAYYEEVPIYYKAVFQYEQGQHVHTLATFHTELLEEGAEVVFPNDEQVAELYSVTLIDYDILWYDLHDNLLTPGEVFMPAANDTFVAIAQEKKYPAIFWTRTGENNEWEQLATKEFARGERVIFPTNAQVAAAYGINPGEYDIYWTDQEGNEIDVLSEEMTNVSTNYLAHIRAPRNQITFTYKNALGFQVTLTTAKVEAGAIIEFPTDEAVATRYGVSADDCEISWYSADGSQQLIPGEAIMPAEDISVVAVINTDIIKYQITFIDGSSIADPITAYYKVGAHVAFPQPAEGYTRTWYRMIDNNLETIDAATFTMPAEEVTMYYMDSFIIPTYTARFLREYLPENPIQIAAGPDVELQQGAQVTFPDIPAEAGYKVVWYRGLVKSDEFIVDPATETMPSAPTTYVARYIIDDTPSTYLATFGYYNRKFITISTSQLAAGELVIFPEVETEPGMVAVWYDDEDDSEIPAVYLMPAEDKTFYYEEEEATTYTVSFYIQTAASAGSKRKPEYPDTPITLQLAAGQQIPFPTVTHVEGYIVNWYYDKEEDPTTFTHMPAHDCEFWSYYDKEPEKVTLTVLASPAQGGQVSGSGTYYVGTKVTVTATPNTGYILTGWSDGYTNIATRTYTVDRDPVQTLTAYFEEDIDSSIPLVDVITSSMVTMEIISSQRFGIKINPGDYAINEEKVAEYLHTLSNLNQLVYVDMTDCWLQNGFDVDNITIPGINPNCLYYFDSTHKITGYINGTNAIWSQVNTVTGITEFYAAEIDVKDKNPFYNKYPVKNIDHAEFTTATTMTENNWSFFTIPFDLKTSAAREFYISRFNEYIEAEVLFNFKQCSEATANQPYAFKLKPGEGTSSYIAAEATSMPVTANAILQTCYDAATGAYATFHGVLEKTYLDGCAAVNGSGYDYSKYFAIVSGEFSRVFNGNLHALRAYIQVPEATNNDAPVIFLFEMEEDNYDQLIIDPIAVDVGIETDLDDLVISNKDHTGAPVVNDNRIYTMDGKYVGMDADTLPRGLYIRNNVKFFVR